MNKKGQSSFGIIIMIFIVAIVGLALIPVIFNEQSKLTTMQTVTNDSATYAGVEAEGQINASYQMNITKEQDDWRSTSCPISSYTFTNSSGVAYTETTDYVFTTAYGNFTLVNTAKVNASLASDNLTLVNYTYCDIGYNKDSGSRGIATLIGLFMTLALLAAVIVGIQNEWFK